MNFVINAWFQTSLLLNIAFYYPQLKSSSISHSNNSKFLSLMLEQLRACILNMDPVVNMI